MASFACLRSLTCYARHSASYDNIRIWNVDVPLERIPFRIVAGHHGGTVSQMGESLWLRGQVNLANLHAITSVMDPTCRFLITASGDRGWLSNSTEAVLLHEITPATGA